MDQILAKRQGMQRKTYNVGQRFLVVTLRDTTQLLVGIPRMSI